MPFKKGKSGNPKGKPPGTKNKIGEKLREMIEVFLDENFDQVVEDFKHLTPKERVKVYSDLLPFVIGKQQTISQNITIEKLPEDQLDDIITRIQHNEIE